MNRYIFLLLCFLSIQGFTQQESTQRVPDFLKGKFTDDYQIHYEISDSLWWQKPGSRYHIIRWNPEKQYLIAQNDAGNKTDGLKYTRIDYMRFEGMGEWTWGFCLSAYKALSEAEAEKTEVADREQPKKGCNGYPFSRMKKIQTD